MRKTKRSTKLLVSHASNAISSEARHPFPKSRQSKNHSERQMLTRLKSEGKRKSSKRLIGQAGRKNIFEINQALYKQEREKKQFELEMTSFSQDNRRFSNQRKNKTKRKLDIGECFTFENNRRVSQVGLQRDLQRQPEKETSVRKLMTSRRRKSKNKKVVLDIEKLEKNLRARKKRKMSRQDKRDSKERHHSKKQFKTSTSNRIIFTNPKDKILISNYLKTERNELVRSGRATPRRSTKIDLRVISINKMNKKRKQRSQKLCKEKLKGSTRLMTRTQKRKRDLDQLQNKQSFESLKLLSKVKKLSREETLLVLKSLQSEKKLRNIAGKDSDKFFLKERKIQTRNKFKSNFHKGKKMGIEKIKSRLETRKKKTSKHPGEDFKFQTRCVNVLKSKSRVRTSKPEFNSEKKRS